jgi:hypothetical protein
MRNSSLSKLPWQNAFSTSSASPHRCGRTFTPFCARASSSGSDSAAQSRTSACNSARPLASASVESGLSTHSVRSTSLPRQSVTTSIRDAVSSTGEMRPCDVGRATFTMSPDATSVPPELNPAHSRQIGRSLGCGAPGDVGWPPSSVARCKPWRLLPWRIASPDNSHHPGLRLRPSVGEIRRLRGSGIVPGGARRA